MKQKVTSHQVQTGALKRHRRSILGSVGTLAVASILILNNIFILVQPTFAAQTMTAYCNQYTDTVLRNACRAGVLGQEDCADYGLIADQATVDICKKAAADRAAGEVTLEETSPSPSPSPDASDDEDTANDLEKLKDIQGLLDQAKSLSDYIDVLHGAGPDSDKDPDAKEGTKEYYINGAGGEQDIIPIQEGTGDSPVILFFNGGGWHANDKVGQCADGQPIAPYDCTGAESPNDRGYAMYDVTYRLGSSGVYYMYEDVMRGIEHMQNNADLYGIDPNKMVIWGDSAGGTLAVRAAASGKSGAKAAVGWSVLTNAYTGLFHSMASFAIGLDHSTCAPTDLAGFANFADLANGGSGDVAEYGQGLSSNDFSALGLNLGGASGTANPLALLTQGLIAGKNLLSAASDVESISSQIKDSNGNLSGFSGSAFNLASKKFVECVDNFNALSPALFASPDSAPTILAEFENDGLFAPEQAYGMRDKLRQLGIQSEAVVLPGSEDCIKKAPDTFGTGCHLGYYAAFVCPTLNFIDSLVQPDRGNTDCATGVAENQGSNEAVANAPPGGGGSSDTGGSKTSNDSSTSGAKAGQPCTSGGSSGVWKDPAGAHGLYCATTIEDQKAACASKGLTWKTTTKGGGYCVQPTTSEQNAGYYTPSYSSSENRYTCPKGGTFTQDRTKGNICKL